MSELESATKFLSFINKFRDIQRRIYATGLSRMENDIEHSYQLAMFCWFLIEKNKLDLNIGKILHYALVHDLVEVYAGDTPFMDKSEETKEEREKKSLGRIKDEFDSNFAELGKVITEYESQNDPESQFVNSADKIIPMLNIYMDEGKTWKDLYPNLDLEKAIEIKTKDVSGHSVLAKIFEEFLQEVLKKREHYFGK